jgi:rhodanese-related sulfurtransferase
MKKLFIIFFVSICLCSCQAQKVTILSTTAFASGIKNNNIQLLDVRTKEEYQQAHIANSLQANWNDDAEFLKRSSALTKEKPVYIYCLSGGRSAAAATNLRKRGYTVLELQGGINAWRNAKMPTEGESLQVKGMSINDFNSFVATHKNVLVDFGAKWCPPCIKMNPVLDSLTTQIPSVTLLRIDLDKDKEICSLYGVSQIPVFHAYVDGKKKSANEGILTLDELKKMFK